MEEFNENQEQPQEQPIEGEVLESTNTTYEGESKKENKEMSIAALVCGILGLVCCCVQPFYALIFQILGIVLGAIGRKKGGKGLGTAGMVCGIVGLVLAIIFIVVIIGFVGVATSAGGYENILDLIQSFEQT